MVLLVPVLLVTAQAPLAVMTATVLALVVAETMKLEL
jgi:hypothetical protein